MYSLLREVHLYPQVPTAEKVQALRLNSKSASAIITPALFPPNSSKHLPNLLVTVEFTTEPTLVEPVKDTNRSLLSSAIF